jgi:hypothetical protein
MEDARVHNTDPRAHLFRSSNRLAGLLIGLGLTAAIVGACSGSPAATSGAATIAPTTVPTTAASEAAPTDTAASPAGGGSGADVATICRHLTNLKSNDYAFGVSFSNIAALAASSKQQTLADLQAFVQEAPTDIQPQAAALLAFWTELAANSSSVNENDPRLTQANDALNAWLAANC